MAEKKKRKKGPNLSVGRGEKLPVSKGAGLTAKGRAKYNKETGSRARSDPSGQQLLYGECRQSICPNTGSN